MVGFGPTDRIASTIIQAIGLLLPAVFISFRYYEDQVSVEDVSNREAAIVVLLLVIMVLALTMSGAGAVLGLLDTGIKTLSVFISIVTLFVFFIAYGTFFSMLLLGD